MDHRLPAHIEATGLIRRAEALGGTGVVLKRGDRDAGTILVALAQRGEFKGLAERSLTSRGRYGWQVRTPAEVERKQSFNDFISVRRRIDPDIWVVELDIPDAERFGAELTRDG